MQVLTLDNPDLDNHARILARMVESESAAYFDAIVAVRRGGSYVCDAFCRYFPKERYGARYDVRLQRPSTKHKDGKLGGILKKLPIPLLDAMRMAESFILAFHRRIKGAPAKTEVEVPAGLASLLRDTGYPSILIIDDAIDSGDTLFSISETLTETNPDTVVRIAVLTQTTRMPRISADYSIYRNRTLIRFPWSNDYKKH